MQQPNQDQGDAQRRYKGSRKQQTHLCQLEHVAICVKEELVVCEARVGRLPALWHDVHGNDGTVTTLQAPVVNDCVCITSTQSAADLSSLDATKHGNIHGEATSKPRLASFVCGRCICLCTQLHSHTHAMSTNSLPPFKSLTLPLTQLPTHLSATTCFCASCFKYCLISPSTASLSVSRLPVGLVV